MGKRHRLGQDAASIAAVLRADIVSGVLAPGSRLGQEQLAERFATSRMPVRDGLRMLEGEGLVLIPRNRSAVVAPLDAADCREITQMRAVLEPLALGHAIAEISDRQLARAERIQADLERADEAQFGALNKMFHQALLTAAQKPRLLAIIASLHELSERYVHVAAIGLDHAGRSHVEHRALLRACRQRDASVACDLLASHIRDAGEALARQLEVDGREANG